MRAADVKDANVYIIMFQCKTEQGYLLQWLEEKNNCDLSGLIEMGECEMKKGFALMLGLYALWTGIVFFSYYDPLNRDYETVLLQCLWVILSGTILCVYRYKKSRIDGPWIKSAVLYFRDHYLIVTILAGLIVLADSAWHFSFDFAWTYLNPDAWWEGNPFPSFIITAMISSSGLFYIFLTFVFCAAAQSIYAARTKAVDHKAENSADI